MCIVSISRRCILLCSDVTIVSVTVKMCCLIRQKCVRRVEKEEVQEKPVTLTVPFAAGQLSHPETLVWSHFYEHARVHVPTRPTVLGLLFPVPFCLLVCDIILLCFGLFVRLSVRCVHAYRLWFIILLWEQHHMQQKMLFWGMQWMKIENFSYFAYHKHTAQIPLILIGTCWSALFVHSAEQTIM